MSKKKVLIITLSVLILITLIFGAYLIYLINNLGDDIYIDDGENGEPDDNSIGIVDLFNSTFKEPLTILVVGVDARNTEEIEGTRSDTIMLITVNPDTKQVATISFPRDSYVFIQDVGYTKLNHSMYYGGIPLLEQTIEENFEINIDNYLAIDFVAFTEIVDELGGLDVNVENKMYYPSSHDYINIDPGEQHMDGELLLDYVRFRNDSEGDLGRIRRQQEAIAALGEKATSFTTLLKVEDMLEILGKHIKTDLTTQDLLSIVKAYSSFSKEDWNSMTFGGEAARSEEDQLWYFFSTDKDYDEAKSFVEDYKSGNK